MLLLLSNIKLKQFIIYSGNVKLIFRLSEGDELLPQDIEMVFPNTSLQEVPLPSGEISSGAKPMRTRSKNKPGCWISMDEKTLKENTSLHKHPAIMFVSSFLNLHFIVYR